MMVKQRKNVILLFLKINLSTTLLMRSSRVELSIDMVIHKGSFKYKRITLFLCFTYTGSCPTKPNLTTPEIVEHFPCRTLYSVRPPYPKHVWDYIKQGLFFTPYPEMHHAIRSRAQKYHILTCHQFWALLPDFANW